VPGSCTSAGGGAVRRRGRRSPRPAEGNTTAAGV
jgi:hypothetical protein